MPTGTRTHRNKENESRIRPPYLGWGKPNIGTIDPKIGTRSNSKGVFLFLFIFNHLFLSVDRSLACVECFALNCVMSWLWEDVKRFWALLGANKGLCFAPASPVLLQFCSAPFLLEKINQRTLAQLSFCNFIAWFYPFAPPLLEKEEEEREIETKEEDTQK